MFLNKNIHEALMFIAYDLLLIELSLGYVVLLISMVNYTIILWIFGDIKEWWSWF